MVKMLKYAPDYLKIENRKKIFDLFVKEKELSRAEIVRRTDMSFPTASKAVDYLISRNIVIENDLIPGKGGLGRKSRLLHLNTKSYYGAGVIFEGNFVEYGIVNLAGELVEFRIDDGIDIKDHDAIGKVADELNTMISKYGDKILGVGVGLPGAVDPNKKIILNSNLIGVTDVPFEEAMSPFADKIKLPIYVDNDVNLACGGEMYATAAVRENDSLIYIYMGTGIGAGICVDGQMLMGCTYRGGEFENSIISPINADHKEILGQKITLEAIKEHIGIDFSKENKLTDKEVDKAVNYLVPYLSVAIANMSLFIDINDIVIAGVIPSQIGQKLYDGLNNSVNGLHPYDGWKVNIKGPSEEGNALIGGASLVFENTILSENGKAN
ncbi:MAG: ROK family protein [Lachnospiraceae bacterium]|nr:ROK family protein [Lachnospiraceae bacterium]